MTDGARSPEAPSGLWFTADTHFGHGGALGLFRRPFPSTAAMDAALIENWNATVAPGDTVWHLGDFAVRLPPARAADLLARLHGTKHLVAGNNDPPAIRALTGWASVQDYAELDLAGRRLVLCHYPLRAWNGQHRGALQLHGHSHGRLKPLSRQHDVGVDAWEYRPVSWRNCCGGKRPDRGSAKPPTAYAFADCGSGPMRGSSAIGRLQDRMRSTSGRSAICASASAHALAVPTLSRRPHRSDLSRRQVDLARQESRTPGGMSYIYAGI